MAIALAAPASSSLDIPSMKRESEGSPSDSKMMGSTGLGSVARGPGPLFPMASLG